MKPRSREQSSEGESETEKDKKKRKKEKKKNKNTSKFRHWEDEKGKKKYFKGTHEVRPREWGRESEGYLKRMSLSWVR